MDDISQETAQPVEQPQAYRFWVDKKNKKVIYLEASKSLVDNIYGILSLPMGFVLKLVNPDYIGPIENIYKSINSLQEQFMQVDVKKDILLNPKPAVWPHHHVLVKTNRSDTSGSLKLSSHRNWLGMNLSYELNIYYCEVCMSKGLCIVNKQFKKPCLNCSNPVTGTVTTIETPDQKQLPQGVGYVTSLNYYVTDDLRIHALLTSDQSMRLAKKCSADPNFISANIEYLYINMTEREVILAILRGSLQRSNQVLTHAFLKEKMKLPVNFDWL